MTEPSANGAPPKDDKEPPSKQFKTSVFTAIFAAICCFTPFLVIVFGMVGLSAWLGWVDYILFPMLFVSLAVLGHALYLRSGKIGPDPKIILAVLAIVFTGVLYWLKFFYAIRISLLAAVLVALYGFYLNRQKNNQDQNP